ncbi:MAG: proline--tRNA ligase [Candidatus Omnitrophica bacterium]|nr:proline--tRNA ligase [Candidatus Omnitrophota bacterium]
MLWTKFLIPTLKEIPQEAEIKSHRLMLRAGLIRKLASGTYSYLPLGLRALQKAERIVREEMDRAGALEVLLPALHPAEIWKESGRLEILGEDMIHFKDRHGRENVLGPTHEEVITDLARREIHSYKQLPVTLYQIQTKFRDEMRPRSGVIRSREFLMKDAYSFHATNESLDETYNVMKEVYKKIFTRCGLDFHVVEADPGAMGGSGSQEFILFSEAGEDRMVQIGHDGPVVSVEMTARKLKNLAFSKNAPSGKYYKEYTPGHSSVEAVAKFLKKKPSDLVKTMIYGRPDGSFFEVLVRGDHEVSEFKVGKIEPGCFMASREAIEKMGFAFGYSGPFGTNLKAYMDEDVLEMHNFVTGANIKDHHLLDVNPGDIRSDDIQAGDFRQVVEGDKSPDGQPLLFKTAIELGHIFKLNLRYSVPLKAHFLDKNGKENPLVMGCYGIGVNRILAAAIEQRADEKGIVWPKNISPFQALVTALDPEDAQSREIIRSVLDSEALAEKGVDVLVDDRQESAGVKFNDADLIGIPLGVILGPKNLKQGKAEIKIRKTGQITVVDIPSLVPEILKALDNLS